jgi:hypothetical protein
MRAKWEAWMMDGDRIVNGVTRELSCKLMSEWLVDVYSNIPKAVGRNAWLKKNLHCFKLQDDMTLILF